MKDAAFELNDTMGNASLREALSWHERHPERPIPPALPEDGIGEQATLDGLAAAVLGQARGLDSPLAFAHMDPPTPWISWITTLWNARLNQNLLHPDTAPVARDLEARVIQWLSPFFGMNGGHMVPGSTVANITGIWAARELRKVEEVVASASAHLSVRKAAHLLGLRYRSVDVDAAGVMDVSSLGDLSKSCLVLTAGTTSVGAVDPLKLQAKAAWTHEDAAWAGPLRLSQRHAAVLDGIEAADSVAVSAHKWLFQPKESAFVLFRDANAAHQALSFGGGYLAVPNVGLLGSHGANAVPLLATLWAWGRNGVARRVEQCMQNASDFADRIAGNSGLELWARPVTGVVAWRSRTIPADILQARLPAGSTSLTVLNGEKWLRNVAANPNVDIAALYDEVLKATV